MELDMKKKKEEAEKELEEYQTEWNKLGKLIEKQQTYDKKKPKSKKKEPQEEFPEIQLKNTIPDHPKPDLNSPRQRPSKQRSAHKGFGAMPEVGSNLEIEAKYSDYKDAFEKIKDVTDVNDMDQLVARFEEAETNNFSLLKYVESLSIEIKELEDEIGTVRAEIKELKENDGVGKEKATSYGRERKKKEFDRTEEETN